MYSRAEESSDLAMEVVPRQASLTGCAFAGSAVCKCRLFPFLPTSRRQSSDSMASSAAGDSLLLLTSPMRTLRADVFRTCSSFLEAEEGSQEAGRAESATSLRSGSCKRAARLDLSCSMDARRKAVASDSDWTTGTESSRATSGKGSAASRCAATSRMALDEASWTSALSATGGTLGAGSGTGEHSALRRTCGESGAHSIEACTASALTEALARTSDEGGAISASAAASQTEARGTSVLSSCAAMPSTAWSGSLPSSAGVIALERCPNEESRLSSWASVTSPLSMSSLTCSASATASADGSAEGSSASGSSDTGVACDSATGRSGTESGRVEASGSHVASALKVPASRQAELS
mmetsp:Transcript_21713/g.61570  ORF Transcript_21713/g.61570 Transcript_21713/m.61570 type:complete len:353 (-) Transcript_21713:231-1289(-)